MPDARPGSLGWDPWIDGSRSGWQADVKVAWAAHEVEKDAGDPKAKRVNQ